MELFCKNSQQFKLSTIFSEGPNRPLKKLICAVKLLTKISVNDIGIEFKINCCFKSLIIITEFTKLNLMGTLKLKGPLSGLRQFRTTERPLKIIKNVFYFTLKAFFVLEMFACLSWLLFMEKNALIRQLRLISKFMMSQPDNK